MSGPLGLYEAGALVGGHQWLELQLFELAGAWVPLVPEPPAKLALDRLSGHSAWRAGQWEERLPVLAGVDRQALVVAPDGGWERCVEELSALEGTVARLSGLYRVVLPRLTQRYRSHWAASSPSADGPTRRTLNMVLSDLRGDGDEGGDVVQDLLVALPAVEAAAQAVVRLESTFVA